MNKMANWLHRMKQISAIFLLSSIVIGCSSNQTNTTGKTMELFNLSYDPTRELFEEFNHEFRNHWFEKTGATVNIKQSHGGSGSQARSVVEGLEADVVTLALAFDIDVLFETRQLIKENWQEQFPNNSTPYTSTIVFLVRKGNPLNIQDWDDLIREDVSVITPNPKISGGARWNYLAAWGYALEKYQSEEKAKEYIQTLYKNVAVLDSGARAATITFVERGIGDVFLSWENEAFLVVNEFAGDEFEIIYPSTSILAEPPVAVVDSVVDKKGTRDVAEAYLQYFYTDVGQELIAKHYYRPRNEEILAKYKDQFPSLHLFTIDDVFGGWQEAQKIHFSDGGVFDKIYQP